MASIFLPTGEDVEDICSKEELVTFTDVSCLYPPDNHVTVKYTVGSRVQTSPSDWIGIFPQRWEDISKPAAKIYLPCGGRGQNKVKRKSVTFSAETVKNLEHRDTSYQFVYVDINNQVLGVSLPFKVTKPRLENKDDDSGSESPVILSSASEDEDDWDLPTQIAAPTGGQSSSSDLSDIVVLSSSPSQEAAKLSEFIPETVEIDEETVCKCSTPPFVEVVIEKSIPNCMETPLVSTQKKVVKPKESKDTPLVSAKVTPQTEQQIETARKSESIPLKSKAPTFTSWPATPMLSQLKIVELSDSSEDEGVEDGMPGKSGAKLISEIPDGPVKPQVQVKASKIPVKTGTPALTATSVTTATAEPSANTATTAATKTTTTPKVTGKQKAKELTKVTEVPVLPETPSTPVKKSKKKRKREQRRAQAKDDSDDGGDELDQTPRMEKLSAPTLPVREEGDVTPGLMFDELTDMDVKTRRQKMKEARRQERKAARSRPGRGDVENDTIPVRLEDIRVEVNDEISLQPSEELKGKNKKQKAVSRLDAAENTSVESQGTISLQSKQELSIRQKKKKAAKREAPTIKPLAGENVTEPEVKQEPTPDPCLTSSHVPDKSSSKLNRRSLPGTEMKELKKKYSQGQKVKASRKARRSCSNRRQARLDCEFQYLFNVDLKQSEQDQDDDEAYDTIKEKPCAVCSPHIALQDTSDSGFPALVQQDKTTSDDQAKTDDLDNGGDDNDDAEPEEDESSLDEDVLEAALKSVQEANWPQRLGAGGKRGKGGQFIPSVPPFVLDIMDALPPASASPDGRSMVEWRRTMLPVLPKHALPVFRSRYKAKFARKYEPRRLKMRRSIVDNIKRKLDVAQRSKESPHTTRFAIASGMLGASHKHKKTPVFGAIPLTYASIVKKSQESKEFCEDTESKISVPDGAGAAGSSLEPSVENCLAVYPVGVNFKPLVGSDGAPDSDNASSRGMSKVAPHFPKEFTDYTSNRRCTNQGCFVPSRASQLQLVPMTATHLPLETRLSPEGSETTAAIEASKQTCAGTSNTGVMLCQSGSLAERRDTPSLHIRPSARALHKVVPSSPPRKPRAVVDSQSKAKASATVVDVDTKEQSALLDLALSSCLIDNAELRANVVSLERQLRQLKAEQQDQQQLRNQQEQELQQLQQQQTIQNEQKQQQHRQSASSSVAKTNQRVKSPEDRKVPVCKWAGKVSKLVRSNTEVVSLSAKLKTNEQEMASLTNQVNTLKEALQAETKRSTRALTKWFKLKLKVKVLRGKLRESRLEEEASSTDVAKVKGQAGKIKEEITKEGAPDTEFEPPCKKRKLNTQNVIDAESSSSITPPPPPPPPVAEIQVPPPQLYITRYPAAPVSPPVIAPPSPPAAAALFSLFPGYNSGQLSPQIPQQPQQPAIPLYHNVHHNQQHQYHQQQQINQFTATANTQLRPKTFSGRGPTRAWIRKKSPPHLPLPTPCQQPFASPPAARLTRPQNEATPCSPLVWPLPFNVPVLGPSSSRVPEHSSPLCPWSAASPPPSPWGTPGAHTPEHASTWQHRPDQQAWYDITGKPHNFHENALYQQQRENEQNAQAFLSGRGGATNLGGYQSYPVDAAHHYTHLPACQDGSAPQQPASPPGQYRSDFMRRMMQGQSRRQPNPYRLFNQTDAAPQSNFRQPHMAFPSPPYGFPQGFSPLQPPPQPSSNFQQSPQLLPVRSPEASFRNTTAFLELTADGLVEASRRDMTLNPFSHLDQPTRLIESSTACRQGDI